MNSLIFLVFIVISLILASIHNVVGATVKMGVHRLSNALSDTSNLFKHEILLTNQEGMCSGSIISDKFVLTAAHCVILKGSDKFIDIDRQPIEVTVGITMLGNLSEFQTVRLVEKIYVPREFANIGDTEWGLMHMIGDIAVLKLNHELGLGRDPRIEAFALPTHHYEENERNNITFTGFGGTSAIFNVETQNYEPSKFPVYLQYAKARVLPPSFCQSLGNAEIKMCAKIDRYGAGTCAGDSGGALINHKKKIVIGVLSYGATMCNGIVPTVYTKVFSYKRFVMNALNDIVDETARSKSLAAHPNYQNALQTNASKYQRIYSQQPAF